MAPSEIAFGGLRTPRALSVDEIHGLVGAFAVASYMNIPIEMKFSTIVIAVGFSTAIGVFFGIYPARRAAKMQPIDALRSM